MKRILAVFATLVCAAPSPKATASAPLSFVGLPEHCRRSCSPECVRMADQMRNSLRDFQQACGGVPPPRREGRLEMFRSDNCTSELVAAVDENTNCENLPNDSRSAWGIRINGEACQNIADVTPREACRTFLPLVFRDAVKVYRSDNCSGDMVAAFHGGTDCNQFTSTSRDAWAIKIGETCQNLSDMTTKDACVRFRPSRRGGRTTKVFRSDNCQSELVAHFNDSTDCGQFTGTSNDAWAIQVEGGVCQDISDLPLGEACRRFR